MDLAIKGEIIRREALSRWLSPIELREILCNYKEMGFTLGLEPPIFVQSGSLFVYDRAFVPNFKEDGVAWIRKKTIVRVREDFHRIQIFGEHAVTGLYTFAEQDQNFRRRCYRLPADTTIFLVHYRYCSSRKNDPFISSKDSNDSLQIIFPINNHSTMKVKSSGKLNQFENLSQQSQPGEMQISTENTSQIYIKDRQSKQSDRQDNYIEHTTPLMISFSNHISKSPDCTHQFHNFSSIPSEQQNNILTKSNNDLEDNNIIININRDNNNNNNFDKDTDNENINYDNIILDNDAEVADENETNSLCDHMSSSDQLEAEVGYEPMMLGPLLSIDTVSPGKLLNMQSLSIDKETFFNRINTFDMLESPQFAMEHPAIVDFNPPKDYTGGGNEILISLFPILKNVKKESVLLVYFGWVRVEARVVSPSCVRCVSPKLPPGRYVLSIRNPDGILLTGPSDLTFEYFQLQHQLQPEPQGIVNPLSCVPGIIDMEPMVESYDYDDRSNH